MVLGSNRGAQCVILLPESWKGTCHVTTLRRPKTDKGAAFVFSTNYEEILELQAHKPAFGSWLLNQSVQSDGRLLVGTPVDILFLVLPYLHKLFKASATRSVPLDQLLEDEEFPDVKLLLRCTALSSRITQIADVKGSDDCQAVCLNMAKTLQWIERKVSNLSNHLQAKSHDVSLGAKSSTFVQSITQRDTSPKTYQVYAFGILSEYLGGEMQELAANHLDIPRVMEVAGGREPLTKIPKLEAEALQPTDDYSTSTKITAAAKKLTVQQKKLAKVDKTGMKSITAFFGKKA